ncbi:hypothetical protein BST27_03505 [Mycobacterium intermedium]|uniref:G domain-containing protein n=1 Tax=Mycobacterium intermedium TaxID=28445 RepID=A0A1E3S851_MYCIE|nr:hypothetical protein BHQ20_22925 [Mycobacterium intermedium]OPE50601.1 hypothetical protein BV508_09510 [Mycobacterium intermedium]ORB09882.1 hypothetical protein BST27_03505 [Mycobacterium intermedium]
MVIGPSRDDPTARVDAMVAAIGPRLGVPTINRRGVVLVTGPWLAGVTGVVIALRERLPQGVVESSDLALGDAPTAVIFVVSAAAPITESDCRLLDAAAANTDAVVCVVSKIDVHQHWREVLAVNRERLAAHAPRYRLVPWVGAAAAPELGEPQLDELVSTVRGQLADSDLARRNRLRAWESRLQAVTRRFDREVAGAGRQARVDALREERGSALRRRREARSETTIALRGHIQRARAQLTHFARNRCASLRSELQQDIAGLSRKQVAGFEAYTRDRVQQVVAEVAEGVDAQLAEVAETLGAPGQVPPAEPPPTVEFAAPPLKSRRLENRLMLLLGVGFGLGVALTLSRVVAGLAPRFAPAAVGAGIAACVVIGLALTLVVVRTRALLADRAVLARWIEEVIAALRSATDQLAVTRVVLADSLLNTEISAGDEVENARVAARVSVIDAELREHAIAAARAAAMRDREMPTIWAALDAVRAELGEPDTPTGGQGVAGPGARGGSGEKSPGGGPSESVL